MRTIALLVLWLCPLPGCGLDQYSGSTPAGEEVRVFLGIPASEPVDFIRWNLSVEGTRYRLHCSYGVGKPNTNGFLHGGRTVEVAGGLTIVSNEYRLENGDRKLSLLALNGNLMHVLGKNHKLLTGTSGWSYTLNNLHPAPSSELSSIAAFSAIEDSLEFAGRTPCNIPGILQPGKQCYKLKWKVVLYAPGEYFLNGTALNHQSTRGRYVTTSGAGGRSTFVLLDAGGKPYLRLLRLEEGVVIFTDAQGNLLVGDHDFSYTLNRRKIEP